MNEVLSVIHARRSTRAFTSQQISRQDLETILEAGQWEQRHRYGQAALAFSLPSSNADKCLALARAVAQADTRG